MYSLTRPAPAVLRVKMYSIEHAPVPQGKNVVINSKTTAWKGKNVGIKGKNVAVRGKNVFDRG